MIPENANAVMLNDSGGKGEIVLSFLYEWAAQSDGDASAIKKQEVAAVSLNEEGFAQLKSIVNSFKRENSEMINRDAWDDFEKLFKIIDADIDEKVELAKARDERYADFI